MIDGLEACLPLLEREGITLLVEPLNTIVDHQGYFLSSSKEAFDIVKQVGSQHVKVLFDIYHQQIMSICPSKG
ncbi:Xylose isomerase-like TIM barrel [Paenibacillus sp. yr247]|nr:Xylose isomerase-like TIM barrel [Paenibacillus sp. yr247]